MKHGREIALLNFKTIQLKFQLINIKAYTINALCRNTMVQYNRMKKKLVTLLNFKQWFPRVLAYNICTSPHLHPKSNATSQNSNHPVRCLLLIL